MAISPTSFWTSLGFRVLSPTLTHANTVIPWAPAVIDSFSQASTFQQASAVALGMGIWGLLSQVVSPSKPALKETAGPEFREALRAARGLDSLGMDRRNRALSQLRRIIPRLTNEEVGALSVSIANRIRETDSFIHRDHIEAICSFFSRLPPRWASKVADVVSEKLWGSQHDFHEEIAPFLGKLAGQMGMEARLHLYDRVESRCRQEEDGYHLGSTALMQVFTQLDRGERLSRVERFLEGSEDKPPRDRRTIAETGWVLLMELLPDEQKEIAPRLLLTFEDRDAVVRRYSADKAMFVIGRFHPHVRIVTAKHLARLLDDPFHEIVCDILRKFRMILPGLPTTDLLRSVAKMMDMLDHEKPYLREQSGAALAAILPSLPHELRKVAFETLVKTLETGDSRFQSNVIRELTIVAGELPYEDRLRIFDVVEKIWKTAVDWLRPDLMDAARDVSWHLRPKDLRRLGLLYVNALGSAVRNVQQRAALQWPSLLNHFDMEDRLEVLRELAQKPRDASRAAGDWTDALRAGAGFLTPVQRIELIRTLFRFHRPEGTPLNVLARYMAEIQGDLLREYAFRVRDADLVVLAHYHESGLPYEPKLWERYLGLMDPSDFLETYRRVYAGRLRS